MREELHDSRHNGGDGDDIWTFADVWDRHDFYAVWGSTVTGKYPISGGCLCGAVRFELQNAPYHTTYCHCRMCQRASGSVVLTWADFKAEDFSLLAGNISYYESSPELERGFCARCGSTLIQRPLQGDWVAVPTGALDLPEEHPMREHCGVESQAPWLTIEDDLPRKTTKQAMGYEIESERQ